MLHREPPMSTTTFLEGTATRTWGGHQTRTRCSDELLGRYQQILEEQRLSWTEHHRLAEPVGLRRARGRLSHRAARNRQLHPAGRAEGLLSRTLRKRAGLRRGDGPHGPGRRPRRPDPAGQSARRTQLGRPQPHPHDGDGMGQRLRPLPAADAKDARAARRPREQQAMELHQPGDRHRRADAAAGEAGHRHRRRPRLPGRPGRPAPRGDRPRRLEAVEHHVEADGQREDRRSRLGVRVGAGSRRGGPARPPTPPPRCSTAASARPAATWPAWATC